MSDRREDQVTKDFEALVKVTNKEMQLLDHFIQAGAADTQTKKEVNTMFFSGLSNKRPMLIAPVAVVAIAAVMFLIPVSYKQTVGWDVSLAMTASALNPEQLRPIATELKSALGVEGVRMELERGSDSSTATMSAYVDADGNPDPNATVQAFAKYLNEKGIKASAESIPKVTEVSSNVWAMTVGQMIQVEVEGKSDEEIEQEIIARLEEAGLDDVEVSVSTEDGDKTRIEIKAECEEDSDGDCPAEGLNLTLTKNGVAPTGEGEDAFIRVKKMIKNGEETFFIDLGVDGKKASIEVADSADLKEAELISAVEEQLQEQDVDLAVKVEDGVLWVGTLKIDCIELNQ